MPSSGEFSRLVRLVEMHGGSLLARARTKSVLAWDGHVVAGPWSSEVGFELLYWIPFLRRLCERGVLEPESVLAISRGGVEEWYRDVAGQYVDLHELYPGGDVMRRARAARQGLKQTSRPSAFDREAVARGLVYAGLPADTPVLHPWLMYKRFRAAWAERTPPGRLLRELTFRSLPRPAGAVPLPLPPRYIAVKPYASGVLPAGGGGQEAWIDLVQRLAAHLPVVVVRAGIQLDDHVDLDVPEHENVIDLAGQIPTERNLDVQGSVIAGAEMLVATYGGTCYLGVLLGVPTVGLYERDRFNLVHHRVARAMVDALPQATRAEITALSIRQLGRIENVFGGAGLGIEKL